MSIFIFSLLGIVFDFIFNLFLPYLSNSLSIFNTCFSIITIFLVYPLFKEDKNYIIYTVIYGIIYDLFFTNLFMYDAIIFGVLGFITIYINSNFEKNIFSNMLYILIELFIYFGIYVFFLFIFNVVPVSFYKFIYLFIHSIISNIIYGTIIYLIVGKLKERKSLRY